MRLPVDTSAVRFAAAGPAEPVLDFETRQPKTDGHGVPLFNILVFAAGTGVRHAIDDLAPREARILDLYVGDKGVSKELFQRQIKALEGERVELQDQLGHYASRTSTQQKSSPRPKKSSVTFMGVGTA